MKTDPPPVRNPDPQLAAADIDTGRFDADTNNFGPRLGLAWSPQGRHYVVRGGWGLFYGRTPSIMLGDRALEQRRQRRVADVHRRRRADLSAEVRRDPDRRHRRRGRASSTSTTDFANAPADAGQRRGRVGARRGTTLTATYLFVDGGQLPRSIDRNLGTLGSRTLHRPGHRRDAARTPSSCADRPFANFQRVIAFESTAESRYNGLTLELNRRLVRRPPVPRRLHAGQGRRHGPRCDGGRPRQRGRRCEVRVESRRTSRPIGPSATTISATASC